MFEDNAGKEFIRMHAQKDHLVRINNDQTGEIGNERKWTIEKGNDNLEIKMGNQNIKLDMGMQNVEAMREIHLTVGPPGMQSSIDMLPGIINVDTPILISLTSKTAISINAPMVEIGNSGHSGVVLITNLVATGVVTPPPPAPT
jgi:hypothetical protein